MQFFGFFGNKKDKTDGSGKDPNSNNQNNSSSKPSDQILKFESTTKEKIIWIDVDVDNIENSEYQKQLREMNLDLKPFHTIQEGVNNVKEYKFEKIYIIIRGTMFEDFLRILRNEKKNISCSLNIIVFTSSKHKALVQEICDSDVDISSGFLFHSKNIFISFKEVKNFFEGNSTRNNNEQDEEFIFEKIENYEQLILPIYYQELIEPITSEEIHSFNQFLIKNFEDKKMEIPNLIRQLEEIPEMPNEIICKYWIRAYTLETEFYNTIKKKLQQKKSYFFIPYIKMMYEGIKNKTFQSESNEQLYRGAIISNLEIENLENYLNNNNNQIINTNEINFPKSILYFKPFQSFTKNRKVAENFMKSRGKNIPENYSKVMFIVQKNENKLKDDLCSNAYVKDYSAFPKEDEVLFFPFSNFGIKELKQNDDHKEIILEYLGKYKPFIEKIKPVENLLNDIPISKFGKDIADFGLIKYNFKSFWEVVKEIEIKEGDASCLLYLGNNILLIAVNNKLKIYDIDKEKNIQNLQIHQNEINDLLKIDEKRFISSSKDKTIAFIEFTSDFSKIDLKRSESIHVEEVNQTIKLQAINLYASCSNDKTIKIWEFDNNNFEIKKDLRGHVTEVLSIYELPQNEIVSVSKGGFLKFWENENCLKTIEISEIPLHNCLSLLNKHIISVGTKKSIIFIDLMKKEKIKKYSIDSPAVFNFKFFWQFNICPKK